MLRISGTLAWNYPIKVIIGPIISNPEAHLKTFGGEPSEIHKSATG